MERKKSIINYREWGVSAAVSAPDTMEEFHEKNQIMKLNKEVMNRRTLTLMTATMTIQRFLMKPFSRQKTLFSDFHTIKVVY